MGAQSFSQSMFTDLCERMLGLCKLGEDESLIVLSQGDERAEYVDAFLTAGQRFGAKVMNLRLPYSSSATSGEVGVWTVGKTPLTGNQPAVDILKGADMVVETLFLLFSDELTEIQQAGTRILTCIEPVDLLARMFPTRGAQAPDRRRRSRRSAPPGPCASRTVPAPTSPTGSATRSRRSTDTSTSPGNGITGPRVGWC